MRVKAPSAFGFSLSAQSATYNFEFEPDPRDEWNGILAVTLNGQSAVWRVLVMTDEEEGAIIFMGVTEGHLVGEGWWFEFSPSASPPLVRYWGNQVVVREDRAEVC